MRVMVTVLFSMLILVSCSKKKTYKSFSEKELDFVSYAEGQEIKMIDSNNIVSHSCSGYAGPGI